MIKNLIIASVLISSVLVSGEFIFPELRILSSFPFPFLNITVELSPGLYFTYDASIKATPDFRIYRTVFDTETKYFELKFSALKFIGVGNFTLYGTVNNQTVNGTGQFVITYNYVDATYIGEIELVSINNIYFYQIKPINYIFNYLDSDTYIYDLDFDDEDLSKETIDAIDDNFNKLHLKLVEVLKDAVRFAITLRVNRILLDSPILV